MKQLITILILFCFACNKQQQQQEQRTGGLLPDNEKAVAKVPLFTSKGFINASVNNEVIARGKQDKAAPKVYFLSPVDQSKVKGTITISVSFSDNVAVTSIELFVDGGTLEKCTYTNSSANCQWNTDSATTGPHLIIAIAKDAAGNTRTVSITVFIETIIVEPPTETGVSLTMPPVLNQGSEGSCVAFSVGYAARSVEYFNATGQSKTFSPEHLYNNVKFSEDCISGTAMQTALDWMVTNGILPYESMPYTSGTCSNTGTEQQKAEALNYKIAGYYKIYTTDKAAIKSMIDSKHPVIISIAGDNSFIGAKAGFVWKVYSGSGYIAHSVVICGYDDSKNAYKIMNSWGTGWGDAGYSWIDYDFFPTRTGTWCYAIK